MDEISLQRALRAQLGAVLQYRSVLGEGGATETLAGDCEALTGRAAAAFAGSDALRLEQLVFPGDAARVRRERDLQLKKSPDYSLQYRLLRPDGTQVWVRDTGSQRQLDDGTLLREGLLADVTASRELAQRAGRFEQELHNSRALLAAISDGNEAHLLVLDGEATVFQINRSWLEYDTSRGLPGATPHRCNSSGKGRTCPGQRARPGSGRTSLSSSSSGQTPRWAAQKWPRPCATSRLRRATRHG